MKGKKEMKKLVVILGIINFASYTILGGTIIASNDALNKDWNFLINKTNETPNDIIQEEFELKTPITKVAGFYHSYSDENTLIWTKKYLKQKNIQPLY
ncbi:hypothetical protein [Spiroplasma sp. hyd1]|nr:hypothetical protein [Spiroplasma sp. hyd1]